MAADDFRGVLATNGLGPLVRGRVTTLQVNVGKRCNQACHHGHVDAGPKRTETMGGEVADEVIRILARNPEVEVLDLTGGAPELNPHFRHLVASPFALERRMGRSPLRL